MTPLNRAKNVYKAIETAYGFDFAREMIDSVVYNVANYDELDYEERVNLYNSLKAWEQKRQEEE